MSIFIVRHGETVQNAARVIQVPATPLSASGREQAERLARRMTGCGLVRIVSSDLARAAETAQCVSARTGVAIEFDPAWRERDFGDLRGTPYSALTLDPFALDYRPPNGEGWAEFHARVDAAWQRVARAAAQMQGNLLVVTHGLVCRALVERHLALAPGASCPARWENAALTEIDAKPPWTVRLLHCTAHLVDAAPTDAVV